MSLKLKDQTEHLPLDTKVPTCHLKCKVISNL